jgi:hypothetical protein
MFNRRSSKGKAKVEVIDLTVEVRSTSNEKVKMQPPLAVTPPRATRPTIVDQASNSKVAPSLPTSADPCTPKRAGPSTATASPTFPSTQGTKRKAQQARITSFFPIKKLRLEPIPVALTPDEKKALREETKVARADAILLAKELEKEQQEEKKAVEDALKTAKAEDRRSKKQARDAEAAHKRQDTRWKADWKDWVQRHKQPDAEFKMPKGEEMWENHVNIKGTKELGLTRIELDCLEHCDVKNPLQPAGEEWAPMKMYRLADVEQLAFRKEGIIAGVSRDDEATLLRQGEAGFKKRLEKRNQAEAS